MSTIAARSLKVSLGDRSYEISIDSNRLVDSATLFERWLSQGEGKRPVRRGALVITDSNLASTHAARVVESLQAAGWKTALTVQPAGETAKSLELVASHYDRMIELQADRRTAVVAVGGGVVGDAAGFVAATYARGVPFLQVPTTLLAAVDSSVGGKVGVNHRLAKNMIGAFHQPRGVLVDVDALSTLPEREYRAGLAEVVKYGVILDEEFFAWLERNVEAIDRRDADAVATIIERSCRLKADVVEQDEFERTGVRAKLNYGHTFAHAFEALSEYGALLHGEAVSIGMVCASRLAVARGMIPRVDLDRQVRLLERLGLPIALPSHLQFPVEDVVERMRLDKKADSGSLRFVLPTRLGHVDTFGDIPENDVRAVLESTLA